VRKSNAFISALTPLSPITAIDTKTGEYIPLNILQEKIEKVVCAVRKETIRLYDAYKVDLFEVLKDYNGTPQAAEYARQKGITTSFIDTMPRNILVKSRLEKLVQHKLISETASYAKHPNEDKNEPSFGWSINLGSVDKHMASLSYDDTDAELNLLWKCWDTEYYISFRVPQYMP
jgi:hypothetical protein